jgi:mycoredoxin
MPEPIILYGTTDCDDTEQTRDHLNKLGIPFREVDIDHLDEARSFVRVINDGYQSTPTLVIGTGKRKLVVTEPSNIELEQILVEAGYELRTPNAL